MVKALEKVETEAEKCFIKHEWEKKKIERENEEAKANKEKNDSENVTLATDDEAGKSAHKIIPVRNALNFENEKAHNWKKNRRVIIPENDDEESEIKYDFIKKELVKETKKYIEEHCDKAGNPKKGNLSKQELNDIRNLRKRAENEELAIYETDKTKKLVLDTCANVRDKMEKHLSKDEIINSKEVTKRENVLNSQTKSWIEILKIGSSCGHKKRTKSNLIGKSNPLPIMRGTAKDHKKGVDPKKGPDMRPIMGARIGPNTGLSQIGSKLLRSIIEDSDVRHDIKCTEELLENLSTYNKSLGSKKNKSRKIIASMDISSFYPSIDVNRGAKIAKIMWNKSNILVENLDTDELIWYISKYGKEENILEDNLEDYLYVKKKKKMKGKKVAR